MTGGEGTRAHWNFYYEKGLVDILHMHKHRRFRGQNGWTAEGWRSIVKHFSEKFPLAGFSKAQIQEKDKELKGSYKALSIAKKKGSLIWDESYGMFNAEPEIWKELIGENPKLKRFRNKPFPLFESLEKLYEGDLNVTSTEQVELPPPSTTEHEQIDLPPPSTTEHEQVELLPPSTTEYEQVELPLPTTTEHVNLSDKDATGVRMNPFSMSMNAQSQPVHVHEIEPTSAASSGQNGCGYGKKRKQSQVPGVLQEYVDYMKKQTETFLDQLDEKKLTNDYSIKNCLNLLESIEELSDEEKAKATNIFKCELNREIFINFKNPNVRLLWVKGEITPKRQANLRWQSMPGQNLSLPVDVSSSGDDYSHDPESAGTKKTREKIQQLYIELAKNSEHALVSEMDTPLSTSCKSPESNHSGSRLSKKNSLQGGMSLVPMNVHLCAFPGHATPQNEWIPNSTGETVDNQEILSEMVDSNGHRTHVHGASAGDTHDMLSIAELRKKMALSRGNSSDQSTQEKVLFVNRDAAEMDQKLWRLRQEIQNFINDKEREAAVILRLQSALRSEGCNGQQFNNVLAELERMLRKS
ncbi:unnamed protein product [Urochloa humidicola]